MACSEPTPFHPRSLSLSDSVLLELRKISQAVDMRSKRLERQAGITVSQLLILREVAAGEDFSVGEIARDVSLSQGTVTGILERMEKRGLVMREKSEEDRRRVLVRITDPGKTVLHRALPLMREPFARQFNRLPSWKQTMILSSLQQLSTIMQTDSARR